MKIIILCLIGIMIIIGMTTFLLFNYFYPSSFEEFTIIVLPDTQLAVQDYPNIFQSQIDWIIENKERLNIKLVLHIGDVVQQPLNETQWLLASSQLSRLNIPLIISHVNHELFNQYY